MERDVLIEALGISADPTTGEIRAARRSIARRLHPDRSGNDRTRTLMAEVNAACDRWIAEIRARRAQPTAPITAPSPASARSAQPPPAANRRRGGTAGAARGSEQSPLAERRLRVDDVAKTLIVLLAVVVATVVVGGWSITTVAAGFLLGAVTAGAFAAVLHVLARSRADR